MNIQRGTFARASAFGALSSEPIIQPSFLEGYDPALSYWHSNAAFEPDTLREIRRASAEAVPSILPDLSPEQQGIVSTSLLNAAQFAEVVDLAQQRWRIDPSNDTVNSARCSLLWLAAVDGDPAALALLARVIEVAVPASPFTRAAGARAVAAAAASWATNISLEVQSAPADASFVEIYDADLDADDVVTDNLPVLISFPLEDEGLKSECTPVLATNEILESAEDHLRHKFPWLQDAAQGLLRSQYLRTIEGPAPFRFPPTLLLGPSGTAKTSFAYSLAEETGLPVFYVSAAGKTGALEIIGSSKTYQQASPSVGVKAISQMRSLNPIIIVDEVDKFGQSTQNGDPYGALATMIESHTARAYLDDYVGAPVDLSLISWIFTANASEPLQGPFLDRLEIVRVSRPTADHFPEIFQHALREIAREAGISIESLPQLSPNVVKAIRDNFRTGVSLRRVKAAIGKSLEIAARHERA